jgi:pimeloyl-ACP methyl ester carboxylesterase
LAEVACVTVAATMSERYQSSRSPGWGSFSSRVRCSVLVVLLVAGMCAVPVVGAGAPGSLPRAAGAQHRTVAARIAWTGCGRGLQCARVRVPLDWARPGGAKIWLGVIRHLADGPGRRIGSLFVNPGGPGGSVGEVRSNAAGLDAAGQGRFDVVGWDIRGAGESSRVRCFRSERRWEGFFAGWSIPTTLQESRGYLRKTAALARECGQVSGSLLAHVSTADTARDLDYLRRLVGDQRLTYLGISGGTFIGQTYANMFPRRVRAMVLDGVVDPVAYTKGNEAGFANMLSNSDRAFDGFLFLCERAGPLRCALAGHGSVAARVRGLLARLRRASIPAPFASPRGELTYEDALDAIVVNMSAGPGEWPAMAAQLATASRGDGSALATRGRLLTTAFSAQVTSPGLPAIGLVCADSPARQGLRAWRRVLARFTAVSSIYGPVLFWWRWAPCASWPARTAKRYTGPWNAATKNPILVIGTTNDPNTPYPNARTAARRLGNAVLLTHQGYSHTSPLDPSACVTRAISAYVVDLVTPPKGTVCPSDRQPFDPNFGQPLPADQLRDR